MGTVRIGGVVKSGPSTQFWLEADWVRQDWGGNYSVLGIWLRAANGPSGSTGSFLNASGRQTAHANGYVFEHSGNPFLPSGYGQNQTRWHDYQEKVFYHDGEGWHGDVGLAMELQYGGVNETHYGSIGAPGRIPKPPTAPRNLRSGNITPTSAGVWYDGPADARGAGIEQYEASWYLINGNGNPIVWRDMNSWGYTSPGGGAGPELLPGQEYHVYVRARNAAGWGPAVGVGLTTLAGGRAFVNGGWRNCRVKFWNGSAWQACRPRTWNGAQWVNTR